MDASSPTPWDHVLQQKDAIPAIYGRVDFSALPERFTTDPAIDSNLPARLAARRPALLANKELVARIRSYTLLGDSVADAYAALMSRHGAGKLIAMLREACDQGVASVDGAPPELVRFMQSMEQTPEWLSMDLVREGARVERNAYAHRVPYVIRGGLIATFMNKYSAMPMALTGALSNENAGRRAKETASFFTTTVLPDAFEPRGAGFKSAAMVRMMHSMVRYNIMARGKRWDSATFGIPIPQVDQMPAGLSSMLLLSRKVLKKGRTAFTRSERGRVELARYRCFLLGMPQDLLPATPQEIVDILLTRSATLRRGFDDTTCGALVRATMQADLGTVNSFPGRFHAWLEHGLSKLYFLRNFMDGDRQAAARVGVDFRPQDSIAAIAALVLIWLRMLPYDLAARIPWLREIADRALVRKLGRVLKTYGHAEFTTSAEHYRPTPGSRAA